MYYIMVYNELGTNFTAGIRRKCTVKLVYAPSPIPPPSTINLGEGRPLDHHTRCVMSINSVTARRRRKAGIAKHSFCAALVVAGGRLTEVALFDHKPDVLALSLSLALSLCLSLSFGPPLSPPQTPLFSISKISQSRESTKCK